MICERCGVQFDTLPMGSWPFCKGDPKDHAPAHSAVITDDIPGGQMIENLGHEPLTFYSKKAIVKAADERGLQPMVRYVEGDKHLTNWAAAIDAQTLANARALVERRARRSLPEIPDEIQCETARFSVEVR